MTPESISHYRILTKLGEGGMGEVYLAEDGKLDRKVAIKLLLAESTADDQAKRRLIREARAAAKLDHPNICSIYEVDDEDSHRFIVMQYIEGETLADRMNRKPLDLNESLDIMVQAADALSEAHAHQIIHRDIKPTNIMITSRGQVKVMDFGLAKFVNEGNPLQSQASTQAMLSTPGMIVGTVPYMSPEQVRGESLDVRSDIFSLGVLFYEIISGHQPFAEQSVAGTISAIITLEPPPLARYSKQVPAELERIVNKALRKDREERYQTARDLLLDLKSLKQDLEIKAKLGDSKTTNVEDGALRAKPAYRAAAKYLVAAAILGLASLLLIRLFAFRRSEVVQPIRPLDYVQLTNFTDSATQPALSPDGRMLTFIRGEGTFMTAGQIYVKLLPAGEPSQLTHDNLNKMSPAFSPDGSRIAYTVQTSSRWLWDSWVVPVLGGEPRQLLANASGLTWFAADGGPRLMFSELKGKGMLMGIVAANESRADARDVYLPPTEVDMAHRSYLSPDRRSVLVVEMTGSRWLPCRVVPFDGNSAGRQVGPPDAPCTYASWSPDGEWIYLSANTGTGFHIWRQRFPDGAPEQVTFGASEEEGIAMAPDGRSFVTSVGTSQSTVWIQDSGERQISSEGYGFLPSFSSDGKTLYYLVRAGSNRDFVTGELWQVELDSGRRERLLPDFVMAHYNVSVDGHRVLFSVPAAGGKFDIWIASLDRRLPPRQLVAADSERAFLTSHGEVFFVAEEDNRRSVYRINEDGSGRQQLASESVAMLVGTSPDGGWALAWLASHGAAPSGHEMGAPSNSIVAYPTGGGSPLLICDSCAHAGGPQRGITAPLVSWSPDGRYIYFSLYDKPVAVPLRPGQSFPVLPKTGLNMQKDLTSLPGAVILSRKEAFPGPNPSLFAFCRTQAQRNLYQIPVP